MFGIFSAMLTVWSLSGLWVKRAGSFGAVVLFHFSRVTTDDLILFCKSSCNPELMKPSLTPQVLLPDPSALDKIALAFLDASAVGVVKMGLSPENLSIDVPAGMCNDTSSQKNGGQSLRDLDHFHWLESYINSREKCRGGPV